MSEDEIITNVKRIIEHKVISNHINNNDSRAIQGLLDLYQKEKELNQELQIRYKIENDKYKEEKEKNKELTDEYMIQKYLINPDFLKDYISKDKIKDKIKELDIEIQQCQYEDDDIEEYKNDMKKEKSRFLRDRKILQELLEENNEV